MPVAIPSCVPKGKMEKGDCSGCAKAALGWKPLMKHAAECQALKPNQQQEEGMRVVVGGEGGENGNGGNAPAADGEGNRVVTLAVACKPFFLVLQARGDATLLDVSKWMWVGGGMCGVKWEGVCVSESVRADP